MFNLKFFLNLILISGGLFTLLIFGGCSSAESANKGAATSANPLGGNNAPTASTAKCEDMIGKMQGDVSGGKGSIPADFPTPPAGSTLCGFAGLGKGTFYLNTTTSDEEILKYYHDALEAQGYQVEKIGAGINAGDLSFSFSRPNQMSGYVSTNGDKDSLGRKFKDFYSIGYDLIKK